MEVILLENIGSLGGLGDTVDVKPGYGRNFLIPQGKAVAATDDNVAKFETRRAELEAAASETLAAAQARGDALAALTAVEIAATAGEEGKLFGSVGTRDIADALTAAATVRPARPHQRRPRCPTTCPSGHLPAAGLDARPAPPQLAAAAS